jgi:hypothetical protein
MIKDEALKQALEALEGLFATHPHYTDERGGAVARWKLGGSYAARDAIEKIKSALAQPAPFAPDWVNYRQGKIDGALEALAEPQEPQRPEFYAELEYENPDWGVAVAVYQRRADKVPLLVHREALPKQQPAQPDEDEISIQYHEALKLSLEHLYIQKQFGTPHRFKPSSSVLDRDITAIEEALAQRATGETK